MSNKGKIPTIPVVSAPKVVEKPMPAPQQIEVKMEPASVKIVSEADRTAEVSFKGKTVRMVKQPYYFKNRPCDLCAGNRGGRMRVYSTLGRTQYLKCNSCGYTSKDTIPEYITIEDAQTYERMDLVAVFTLSQEQIEKLKSRPVEPI